MNNFSLTCLCLAGVFITCLPAQTITRSPEAFDELMGVSRPAQNTTLPLNENVTRGHFLSKEYIEVDTLTTSKTLFFDFSTTDTLPFSNRFALMGEIPIYGRSIELLLFDSNNNGRDEIIGLYFNSKDPVVAKTQYYELNTFTSSFDLVHDFGVLPEIAGGGATTGGDMDQDGFPEVYLSYSDSLRVYEADHASYAVHYRETLHPTIGFQPAGYCINDLDKDGLPELLFLRDVNKPTSSIAAVFREYSPAGSSLVVTAQIAYPGFGGEGSFAIDDFDGDGKTEIFKTNILGQVFGLENVANDSFRVHFLGQVNTSNGYYNIASGDLDGDGRPEAYLGGYYNFTESINRIVVVEATGNNTYEASLHWEISPGGGFYTQIITTGDVDGDGRLEIILDTGGWVSVFKVIGDDNYELFWLKKVSFPDGLGVGDVDGDGIDEIVIAQSIRENGQVRSRSTIYKFNPGSVGVEEQVDPVSQAIQLEQNYPNPFNPLTHIVFSLQRAARVTVDIYNLRGQHIERLTNRRMSAGDHQLAWHAGNQPSGVYFAKLTADGESRSQKMVLLR